MSALDAARGQAFEHLVACERTDEHYAENYFDIEQAAAPLFRLDEALLAQLVRPGQRVLDAMCGPGRHLASLAARGAEASGNDYNPHMLALARRRLAAAEQRARLSEADIVVGLPYESGTFDWTICMFHSLGAIPGSDRRARAARELARVTKPGGRVLVHGHNLLANLGHRKFLDWTIPHLVSPALGHERGDRQVNGYGNGRHVRADSFIHVHVPWELVGCVAGAGLQIDRVHFLDYGAETRESVSYDAESEAALGGIAAGFLFADGLVVEAVKGG